MIVRNIYSERRCRTWSFLRPTTAVKTRLILAFEQKKNRRIYEYVQMWENYHNLFNTTQYEWSHKTHTQVQIFYFAKMNTISPSLYLFLCGFSLYSTHAYTNKYINKYEHSYMRLNALVYACVEWKWKKRVSGMHWHRQYLLVKVLKVLCKHVKAKIQSFKEREGKGGKGKAQKWRIYSSFTYTDRRVDTSFISSVMSSTPKMVIRCRYKKKLFLFVGGVRVEEGNEREYKE